MPLLACDAHVLRLEVFVGRQRTLDINLQKWHRLRPLWQRKLLASLFVEFWRGQLLLHQIGAVWRPRVSLFHQKKLQQAQLVDLQINLHVRGQ